MSLKATNLFLVMSPIPPTFQGSPQDLATEMLRRMKILSPGGINFIFIGDSEPTSNVGPWLKDGTKWYVFDDATKHYVPLDVSDSITLPFWMSNSVPASATPSVWLKTTQDASETNLSHGQPIGWNVWNGSTWVPFAGIVLSGPSANRPSAPDSFQQYYDTDINVLIWWERSAWRTVDGVPGDIKAVTFPTASAALLSNPGWDLLGSGTAAYRGRVLIQATQDAGPNPATVLTPVAGVPVRQALSTFGESNTLKTDNTSTLVYPPELAVWHLTKM